MIAGVSGRLITTSFAATLLTDARLVTRVPAAVARAVTRLSEYIDERLGPAVSVRATTDAAILPLLRILGFEVVERGDAPDTCRLRTAIGSTTPGPLVIVCHWDESLDRIWRRTVADAIAADAQWCICSNGRALRIVDARRTWSREHVEFDLRTLASSPDAITLLWTLARADAMGAASPTIEAAAAASLRHGIAVCRALGDGVLEAVQLLLGALSRSAGQRVMPSHALEQALTVLYRVLFLLFAEARGLVPTWHPVYRDRYSIEGIVSMLSDGRSCRGLWQAVQAISRMAHAGCAAGELRVTAFNGRLFAPAEATAFARAVVDDAVMRRVILAVSTTRTAARAPRTRIAYRDLDVEQLGAVYERVLDFEPASHRDGPALVLTRDRRKSSGTFYTPRSVTSFLVRRTLQPLVDGRSAEEILRLRIVDPAMGSGAFLVGALRYLSSAVEDAFVREGRWHASDITPADRASLRREIATRCLYGVDLNPTAVQLARLSLWLATLAGDKPLSFLDHHLVAGNSLVGASPDDLRRQPSRDRSRSRRREPLPLFTDVLDDALGDAAAIRVALATDPDDSPEVVRTKERTLAALVAPGTPLVGWSRALDVWCAGWFWPDSTPPDGATLGSVLDRAIGRPAAVPATVAERVAASIDGIAADMRFLHWQVAFPEVFAGVSPGFDAVIGNPPWDMVRGDSGDAATRIDRRRLAEQMVSFVRESGIYRWAGRAHVNRYQLFVERALHLVRRDGRIGLVLPSGIATDAGAAALRRHLFDRAEVDSLTGMDNRAGVFPIHRSVRFALVTCTAGRRTDTLACRFGVPQPAELDGHPRAPLMLTRRLIERISGADDLGIPELTSGDDLRIVEHATATIPWLGGADGWNVQFGRELNASDDRGAFVPFRGASTSRPVVEGKQIEPFRVSVNRCRLELRADAAQGRRVPRRARLAYRDVASATNRLTLIAAIVPARAVTTHTLFCLRKPLPVAHQQVLCALLNSFMANYLVRLRVTTHVTVSLVTRLPVPLVTSTDPTFARLASIADTLAGASVPAEELPEYVEMQALVARLYGVTARDFAHILDTFPLIPQAIRREVLLAFSTLR